MTHSSNILSYRHLGIETQHEHVVFMRSDCHICISEGFEALTRLRLSSGEQSIVASLQVFTDNHLLEAGELGLSNSARLALQVKNGDFVQVSHLSPIPSLSYVRSKIYGHSLSESQLRSIVDDIVAGNYSNVHLAAFITACAGQNLSVEEITALSQAMIRSGTQLEWYTGMMADKHCVGGLPGNRTTPIIVAIVAAAGLNIAKTSSRAITSPAGTADTMEVMTPVTLNSQQIRKVVEREGGCIVWGGTARLSPADDILIRTEKALDLDSEGQMVASVLSKKAASGSTHVVIDIPVGPTAKVRSHQDAQRLGYLFTEVGKAIDLRVQVLVTDGSQPVGRGIGPMLEAIDVLSVLRMENNAPQDLRQRAVLIAGNLLELTGMAAPNSGIAMAENMLSSGKALEKFMRICRAQGGFTEPSLAPFKQEIRAEKAGLICGIDNRMLAKLAKLAGAPLDKKAGIWFEAPLGKRVEKGQTLYTLHAGSQGGLSYALSCYNAFNGKDTIRITG